MPVTDKDNGMHALLARVKELETASWAISVGVHDPDAKQKADGSLDQDLTIVDVASFHEFGLGNNPRRSFIGDYIDQNQKLIQGWCSAALQKYLKGELNREQVLNLIGVKIAGGIQARIATNIPPALKTETILRKGSSVALIDTGQLRTSITYRLL